MGDHVLLHKAHRFGHIQERHGDHGPPGSNRTHGLRKAEYTAVRHGNHVDNVIGTPAKAVSDLQTMIGHARLMMQYEFRLRRGARRGEDDASGLIVCMVLRPVPPASDVRIGMRGYMRQATRPGVPSE